MKDEKVLTLVLPRLKKNIIQHYKQNNSFIQPIQICVFFNLNFCQGNYIKYISRCHEKGKEKDLDKACDYLYWACQIIEQKADDSSFIKIKEKLQTAKIILGPESIKQYMIFDTFLDQHNKELKEILDIFLKAEDFSNIIGIKRNELIKEAYDKINEYSKNNFNKNLTNNILYEHLKGE